jgi:hypothetical protein
VVVGLFQVQAQVPPHIIQEAIGLMATVLLVVGLPGMVAAIVIGHVALVEAKRFALRYAWRGLAITGLALGYLSVAYAIWLVVQFFLSGSSLLE